MPATAATTRMLLASFVAAAAACDDQRADAPAVSAEATKRECPEPRVPLSRRLGERVDEVVQGCQPRDPLATDATIDAAVTGRHTGEFGYDDEGSRPVALDVSLTIVDGVLTGTMSEPDTFSGSYHYRLDATLVGRVFASGQVVFMKTYATGSVSHSILYVGRLDGERRRIEGRWQLGSSSGPFWLQRE